MSGLFDLNLANLAKDYVPPPPSEQTYYQHIGQFIVAYAQAECVVHELARKLSGINEASARAVFHGMRGGDLKNRILAMVRLSKRSRKVKTDIENCLQHFDVIGTQRDKLAHRSTTYEGGTIKITNKITAKSMLEYEQDLFHATDLIAMYRDCLVISIRLRHIVNPALRRAADREFRQLLQKPWLYKLAQPKIQKKPSRESQMIAKLLSQQPA